MLSTCRTQGQALELLANVVASLDPEGKCRCTWLVRAALIHPPTAAEGHWLSALLQDANLLSLVRS